MSWLKVDDGFAEHEKIIDLSDRAFRLHVAALCYCARNLTDGVLRKRQVAAVCAITSANRKQLLELVSAGLWNEHGKDGGYRINDYLEYQESSATIKQRRAEARDRMRKRRSGERSREQTAHVRGPETETETKTDASALSLVQTRAKHRVRETIGRSLAEAASC